MHSKLSIAFISATFAAAFATPFCPGGAEPFEGTGRGASESKARENANLDIASLFSTIKVNILDELTQRETSNDIKEYANYQRKIKIESGLYTGYIKDAQGYPQKEDGQFVAKRYLCPSDAAKPYLDSLKSINQRVGIQKLSNSFCESLYKTYSPRVVLFERILERLGETDEARIADYKRVEKECDEMRGYIKKGYVGFEEALDKAVAEIVSKRGKIKTKIVIAEIYASPSNLSDFISSELESKLVKVKTFSVEPANVNAISYGETFKIGPMKYADAMEMGRYSKANIVLIGNFDPYDGFSYFKLKALEVQPPPKTIAMHTDKIRPDDAELADLITGKPPAITDEALAYLSKGEDLYREGKYDDAIRELDRALAMNGNLAEGYYFRGNAYDEKGNLDRAIEDYDAALRIKPDYINALNDRGIAHRNKGNYDKAIEDYDAALKIKPDFHYALCNRGAAYYRKGNPDRAIEDYNAAIRIKPDFHEALYNRGVAYKNKGNLDRAIEDYTAVLRIKPDYYRALLNRSVAYSDKGNLDRAIEGYTAALRIKPDLYQALYNRGIAYAKKGNLDRAIEDYTAALRIEPDLHQVLYNRGIVYYRKGNLDRAIEDYTAALRIKPDKHEALYSRGNAYSNKGNLDRAIEDFEAVLRIDPNNTNARNGLEIARQKKQGQRSE
jgi:tetratricopeptide (TPR) repeat protein